MEDFRADFGGEFALTLRALLRGMERESEE
jgi:hypothetical protein